ncbi:MAG: hypothetical protein CTY23_01045 [Methylomonas sp.]|nr:MAG: hypothetical protein CTY23_01045 [Methylomonas sp.]
MPTGFTTAEMQACRVSWLYNWLPNLNSLQLFSDAGTGHVLVPTLRVGTQTETLCVPNAYAAQSAAGGIPTRSVGTRSQLDAE